MLLFSRPSKSTAYYTPNMEIAKGITVRIRNGRRAYVVSIEGDMVEIWMAGTCTSTKIPRAWIVGVL